MSEENKESKFTSLPSEENNALQFSGEIKRETVFDKTILTKKPNFLTNFAAKQNPTSIQNWLAISNRFGYIFTCYANTIFIVNPLDVENFLEKPDSELTHSKIFALDNSEDAGKYIDAIFLSPCNLYLAVIHSNCMKLTIYWTKSLIEQPNPVSRTFFDNHENGAIRNFEWCPQMNENPSFLMSFANGITILRKLMDPSQINVGSNYTPNCATFSKNCEFIIGVSYQDGINSMDIFSIKNGLKKVKSVNLVCDSTQKIIFIKEFANDLLLYIGKGKHENVAEEDTDFYEDCYFYTGNSLCIEGDILDATKLRSINLKKSDNPKDPHYYTEYMDNIGLYFLSSSHNSPIEVFFKDEEGYKKLPIDNLTSPPDADWNDTFIRGIGIYKTRLESFAGKTTDLKMLDEERKFEYPPTLIYMTSIAEAIMRKMFHIKFLTKNPMCNPEKITTINMPDIMSFMAKPQEIQGNVFKKIENTQPENLFPTIDQLHMNKSKIPEINVEIKKEPEKQKTGGLFPEFKLDIKKEPEKPKIDEKPKIEEKPLFPGIKTEIKKDEQKPLFAGFKALTTSANISDQISKPTKTVEPSNLDLFGNLNRTKSVSDKPKQETSLLFANIQSPNIEPEKPKKAEKIENALPKMPDFNKNQGLFSGATKAAEQPKIIEKTQNLVPKTSPSKISVLPAIDESDEHKKQKLTEPNIFQQKSEKTQNLFEKPILKAKEPTLELKKPIRIERKNSEISENDLSEQGINLQIQEITENIAEMFENYITGCKESINEFNEMKKSFELENLRKELNDKINTISDINEETEKFDSKLDAVRKKFAYFDSHQKNRLLQMKEFLINYHKGTLMNSNITNSQAVDESLIEQYQEISDRSDYIQEKINELNEISEKMSAIRNAVNIGTEHKNGFSKKPLSEEERKERLRKYYNQTSGGLNSSHITSKNNSQISEKPINYEEKIVPILKHRLVMSIGELEELQRKLKTISDKQNSVNLKNKNVQPSIRGFRFDLVNEISSSDSDEEQSLDAMSICAKRAESKKISEMFKSAMEQKILTTKISYPDKELEIAKSLLNENLESESKFLKLMRKPQDVKSKGESQKILDSEINAYSEENEEEELENSQKSIEEQENQESSNSEVSDKLLLKQPAKQPNLFAQKPMGETKKMQPEPSNLFTMEQKPKQAMPEKKPTPEKNMQQPGGLFGLNSLQTEKPKLTGLGIPKIQGSTNLFNLEQQSSEPKEEGKAVSAFSMTNQPAKPPAMGPTLFGKSGGLFDKKPETPAENIISKQQVEVKAQPIESKTLFNLAPQKEEKKQAAPTLSTGLFPTMPTIPKPEAKKEQTGLFAGLGMKPQNMPEEKKEGLFSGLSLGNLTVSPPKEDVKKTEVKKETIPSSLPATEVKKESKKEESKPQILASFNLFSSPTTSIPHVRPAEETKKTAPPLIQTAIPAPSSEASISASPPKEPITIGPPLPPPEEKKSAQIPVPTSISPVRPSVPSEAPRPVPGLFSQPSSSLFSAPRPEAKTETNKPGGIFGSFGTQQTVSSPFGATGTIPGGPAIGRGFGFPQTQSAVGGPGLIPAANINPLGSFATPVIAPPISSTVPQNVPFGSRFTSSSVPSAPLVPQPNTSSFLNSGVVSNLAIDEEDPFGGSRNPQNVQVPSGFPQPQNVQPQPTQFSGFGGFTSSSTGFGNPPSAFSTQGKYAGSSFTQARK